MFFECFPVYHTCYDGWIGINPSQFFLANVCEEVLAQVNFVINIPVRPGCKGSIKTLRLTKDSIRLNKDSIRLNKDSIKTQRLNKDSETQ